VVVLLVREVAVFSALALHERSPLPLAGKVDGFLDVDDEDGQS